MADDIGSVNVSIGADYEPLQAAFTTAKTLASTEGANIADALATGAAGADNIGATIADDLGKIGPAAQGAADSLTPYGDEAGKAAESTTTLGTAATGAKEPIEDVGTAASTTSPLLREITTQLLALGGITLSFEELKDLVTDMLAITAERENFTTSMTLLTGSVEGAHEALKSIDEFSFQNALDIETVEHITQKMTAFGLSTDDTKRALQAAADAAAATGTSFDTAAEKLNNMAMSGMAGNRQLVQLGLSTTDLGTVMGVAGDEVKAAFKDMDQSERINVLTEALTKFAGAGEAIATGLAGQWQNFKNDWHQIMVDTGADAAIFAEALLYLADTGLTGLVDVFTSSINTIKDFKDAIVLVATPIADFLASLKAVKDAAGPAGDAVSGFIQIVKDYNFYHLVSEGIHGIANEASILTGTIPNANVMTQAMQDKLKDLNKTGTDSAPIIKAMNDEILAAEVAHRSAWTTASLYVDVLNDAKTKYNSVVKAYTDGKGTAADVLAAQKALTAAQTAYDDQLTISKVPDQIKATKDFVAPLTAVWTEQDLVTAKTLATASAHDGLLLKLGLANEALVTAAQKYSDAATSGGDMMRATNDLKTAQDAATTAQTNLNKGVGDFATLALHPPTTTFETGFKSVKAATEDATTALAPFFTAVEKPHAPAGQLVQDFIDIGVKTDAASEKITGKMLTAFSDLKDQSGVKLGDVKDSWGKVSKAVDDLADVDMPKVLTAYQDNIDLLVKAGASESDVKDAIQKKLDKQIEFSDRFSSDANATIVALDNIGLKHDWAKDKATAWGDVYTGIFDGLKNAFSTLGDHLVDAITGATSWHDAWQAALKDIEKYILDTLIGIGFKALGDGVASLISGLVGQHGVMEGVGTVVGGIGSMSTTLQDVLNQTATTAGLATTAATTTISDASTAAGTAISSTATTATSAIGSVGSSVLSIIGAVGSAVSAIANIFEIFQNAQQETTLNAIEHNTRYSEIVQENLRDGVWWPMKANSDYMVGSLNDINAHTSVLGDISSHTAVLGDMFTSLTAIQASLSTGINTGTSGDTNSNATNNYSFNFSGSTFGEHMDQQALIDEIIRQLRNVGTRI